MVSAIRYTKDPHRNICSKKTCHMPCHLASCSIHLALPRAGRSVFQRVAGLVCHRSTRELKLSKGMADRAAQLRAMMKAKSGASSSSSSSSSAAGLSGKEKLAYLKAKKEKELAAQAKINAKAASAVPMAPQSSASASKPSKVINVSSLQQKSKSLPPPESVQPKQSQQISTVSSPLPESSSSAAAATTRMGIGALAAYGDDDEDDADQVQQPQGPSGLPMGFFDAAPNPVPLTPSVYSSSGNNDADGDNVEEIPVSTLPMGFFDDPTEQKLAAGVDIEKEKLRNAKKEGAELANFLEQVENMPDGYDDADINGNGDGDEVADMSNSTDAEILEQGLQLAYESKVLNLKEKSEKFLSKKRKNVNMTDNNEDDDDCVVDTATSEKIERELEYIAREALSTVEESNNDDDGNTHDHDDGGGDIDFAAVMRKKLKKTGSGGKSAIESKYSAYSEDLNMGMNFMDWTSKAI